MVSEGVCKIGRQRIRLAAAPPQDAAVEADCQSVCYRGVGKQEMASVPAVSVQNLVYRYGERDALKGISFLVEPGQVFGLLGPNGGGKTTLFRILSTLLLPADGRAEVFSVDVAKDPLGVRRQIGVVFQNQSLDRRLTAAENLVHQGHLYGLRGNILRDRIDRALDRVGLADRRNSVVETLSGGMRRRLELAKGLLHSPRLLLLDEPSTGVDPGGRRDFWDYLQLLRREEGVTILLTTHLLDEADKCDRLAILDEGSLVAQGTPSGLKSEIGGEVVILAAGDPHALLADLPAGWDIQASVVGGAVRFEHPEGSRLAARLMEELPQQIESVTVSRPSLEDVFIHMTGHRFGREAANGDQG